MITINDKNYKEVLRDTHLPVLIDFWAEWCAPCKRIAPTIESISNKTIGQWVVGKCNIENGSELVDKYHIKNIPTLLFIRDGVVLDQMVGYCSEQDIIDKMETLRK